MTSYSKGFSMLELLVVMGIFTFVSGLALFVSMETFRGTDFRSDRNLLVATLERARAQSMNNICSGTCTDGKAHGVHIASDSYTLFQGTTYSSGDIQNAVFTSNTTITKSPATLDVVFDQLSGKTTATSITLSSDTHTSVITIGNEGEISWTN